MVPEPTPDSPVVLAPEMVRRPPLWGQGERRLAKEEVWDRLRREPELPMLLRETDLLPTLRAGLITVPDAVHSVLHCAPAVVDRELAIAGLPCQPN